MGLVMTKQCRSRNQHQDGYKTYQELIAESKDKEDEHINQVARNGELEEGEDE